MKLSVDESVHLAAHRPISTDPLHVLIPQGDNGITSVGLPIQSHDTYLQYAMRSHMIHSSSQMDSTANENAAAISSFQSSSTLGNHVVEELHPLVSDDLEILLALFSQSPPHDDSFFKTPLYYGGSVRRTRKGVHGWMKLKAVMKWGIFIRKIAMTRREGIVQLDELPIEFQA
ncbi:hypothetical protein NL676_007158 [Syzygium grande]|nr:hypothetical protein NL676_007158 [Syzygium grande]